MSTRNVHLLVLIHGMWGNPVHLAEMNRIIAETKGPGSAMSSGGESDSDVELDVLVSQTNRDESTYDGIDWGGERVADEVHERVKEIENAGRQVIRFSVTGYSLGGLLARYVIGVLHQRSFFDKIQPVNFSTFATPHIGLVRSPTVWSFITYTLGPRLLSRTGEQVYVVDQWGDSGRGLLEVMADQKELFYQALSLFPNICIYGNAVNDTTVPYVTALIETVDPFAERAETGINVEFDPKYDPIIISYSIPDTPPDHTRPKPLSFAWFRAVKPSSFLPPPLQSLKFPLNAIATLLIPILIPTFITLIIVRLTLHTRSSRARIRLLEHDENGRESKLVHAFSRLERELEGAVVEIAENDMGVDEGSEEVPEKLRQSSHWCRFLEQVLRLNAGWSHAPDESAEPGPTLKNQPLLSPAHLAMAHALNTLPQLSKYRVYLDPVRNSHATIIARDVKGFAFHQRGWGVLRHWADGFAL
ncbi:DUF676-domain-containing protein [Phellopilus nigrolimitatus]|nr:DUF676-domain-containing protein [Phellopilus nigrolimitatus]